MTRSHATALIAALALVALVSVPVAAKAGKAYGTPTPSSAVGGIDDCTDTGDSYSSGGTQTINPGDTCITLTFTPDRDVTNGNVNWGIPAGTSLTVGSYEIASGSCTFGSASLVLTGGGVQLKNFSCSNGAQISVYVDATVASSIGSYPLTGGFKTDAGGRSGSNMYGWTYTVTVANACGASAGGATILC